MEYREYKEIRPNSFMHYISMKNPPDFKRLYCRCPIQGCKDDGKKHWYHSNCGGNTEINSKCSLRCSKHTETESFALEWSWKCAGHENIPKKPNIQTLMDALSVCLGQATSEEDQAWGMRLLNTITAKIQEECKKHRQFDPFN